MNKLLKNRANNLVKKTTKQNEGQGMNKVSKYFQILSYKPRSNNG